MWLRFIDDKTIVSHFKKKDKQHDKEKKKLTLQRLISCLAQTHYEGLGASVSKKGK